jgi:hypothetical protein
MAALPALFIYLNPCMATTIKILSESLWHTLVVLRHGSWHSRASSSVYSTIPGVRKAAGTASSGAPASVLLALASVPRHMWLYNQLDS